MIFVLIAGSYTPFAMLVLHGPLAVAILVAVWAGALVGVAFNLGWSEAPTWLRAALYVCLGWVALAALPQLGGGIGMGGMRPLGLGGGLYTLGAIVYAVKRPDPGAIRVRISRSLLHPRDRGGRVPVRGDRLLDPPRVRNLGAIKKARNAPLARRRWFWPEARGHSA